MPKIRKITIQGVYGRFDHTIHFRPDSPTVIIHAPNGYGKTETLRIVDYLLRRQFEKLSSAHFDSLEMSFEDGTSVLAEKVRRTSLFEEEMVLETSDGIIFSTNTEPSVWRYERNSTELTVHQISQIDGILPFLDQVGPSTWVDMRSGENLSLGDVLDQFRDNLPEQFRVAAPPAWLREITGWLDTRLIETQRLVLMSEPASPRRRSEPERRQHVVTNYARDLANRVTSTVRLYASRAQKLDQTFPTRLINEVNAGGYKDQLRLTREFALLEEKRAYLAAAGLLDQVDGAHPILTGQPA